MISVFQKMIQSIEYKKISAWEFFPHLRKNPLATLSMFAKQGDLIQLPNKSWIINHPDVVQHILGHNADNYTKLQTTYKRLQMLMGSGLLTNSGIEWAKMRPIFQEAFRQENFIPFIQSTEDICMAHVNQWSSQIPDVMVDMLCLSAKIAAQVLFGVQLSSLEAQIITEHVLYCNEFVITTSSTNPMLPLPKNIHFWRARSQLNKILYQFIKRSTQPNLIIDCLPTPPKKALDEIKNIFIAGFETTGMTLTWILYNLSQYHDCSKKVSEELATLKESTTVNKLNQLDYTNQVISETQRLYPPIWLIHRRAIEKDMLGPYPIYPGDSTYIFTYILHYNKKYWDNPAEFNPTRFNTENIRGRPKGCFLPYGMGPRVCVAKHLSLLFIKLALKHILPELGNFSVSPDKVDLQPWITLKAKQPLVLQRG